MARRRSGSVRFDPYLKVQFYNPRSLAWQDVQRSFRSDEAAHAAIAAGDVTPPPGCNTDYRFMRITEAGRAPDTIVWSAAPEVA